MKKNVNIKEGAFLNTDSLIKYLNNNKKIKIEDSQKTLLKNLGYYHSYKGYRFVKSPQNELFIDNFNEIVNIYQFDMKLKSLFYSKIMFIETAMKNYTLDIICEKAKSSEFEDIFEELVTRYKEISNKEVSNKKKAIKNRLHIRKKIYSTLESMYKDENQVIKHFYNNHKSVPIWAIFEVISLGDFGTLLECMNTEVRKDISKSLKINTGYDTWGVLPSTIAFVLKDLRNSIAHNNIIFDCRFKKSNIDNTLAKMIQNYFGISDINFNSITDYIIFVVYLLNNFNLSNEEILDFINKFVDYYEELRKSINYNNYDQIIHTNTRNKITKVKEFIENREANY